MAMLHWWTHRKITSPLIAGFSGAVPSTLSLAPPRRCVPMAAAYINTPTAAVAVVSVAVAAHSSWLAGFLTFVALMVVRHERSRRREADRWQAIDRDLPTLLTTVASSVKAGMDPLTAVAHAHQFFAEGTAMRRELERFAKSLNAGDDELQVIRQFMAGGQSRDVDLLKRCLLLSRRHGSSLAEPLHRITRVVRQRHSFRRKTRAALAMHRLSAFGIAVCALLIALLQVITNIEGVSRAVSHPVGGTLLAVGGVLILTGVTWMARLGRSEAL